MVNTKLLAEAFRKLADAFDSEDEPEEEPKSKRKKTSAARALAPDATAADWRVEPLESANEPGLFNLYQILQKEFGLNQFDVRDIAKDPGGKNPAKKLFTTAPSLSRVMLGMKELEAEELARPMDKDRLHWILERQHK